MDTQPIGQGSAAMPLTLLQGRLQTLEAEFHVAYAGVQVHASGQRQVQAERLDIQIQIQAVHGIVEYKGQRYEVMGLQAQIRIDRWRLEQQTNLSDESADPIELALKLAHALAKVARQKGKKHIVLQFDRSAFAKLASIDNGRFLFSIVALAQAIVNTSEWIYRDQPGRNTHIVTITDPHFTKAQTITQRQKQQIDLQWQWALAQRSDNATSAPPRRSAAEKDQPRLAAFTAGEQKIQSIGIEA